MKSVERGIEYKFNHTPYLLSLFGLMLVFIGLIYFKILILIKFILNTNSVLHKKLIESVSKSKISFFDKTPCGAILNRFSSDLGVLDKSLWVLLYDMFS